MQQSMPFRSVQIHGIGDYRGLCMCGAFGWVIRWAPLNGPHCKMVRTILTEPILDIYIYIRASPQLMLRRKSAQHVCVPKQARPSYFICPLSIWGPNLKSPKLKCPFPSLPLLPLSPPYAQHLLLPGKSSSLSRDCFSPALPLSREATSLPRCCLSPATLPPSHDYLSPAIVSLWWRCLSPATVDHPPSPWSLHASPLSFSLTRSWHGFRPHWHRPQIAIPKWSTTVRMTIANGLHLKPNDLDRESRSHTKDKRKHTIEKDQLSLVSICPNIIESKH